MSVRTQQVLTVDEQSLTMYVGGQSYVGVRLAGTWVATITFEASTDGLNFNTVTVTPFATGTGVQTATATGNWWFAVANYVAFRVRISAYTSGSVQVYLSASQDAGYQDAFLAPSSIFVSQESTSTNTVTQALQANRAWNLRTLTISLAGLQPPGGRMRVEIFDGAITGTVLHAQFLQDSDVAGSVGRQFEIKLPPGGITGTPGTAMTVRVFGGGASQTTIVNAEFRPA